MSSATVPSGMSVSGKLLRHTAELFLPPEAWERRKMFTHRRRERNWRLRVGVRGRRSGLPGPPARAPAAPPPSRALPLALSCRAVQLKMGEYTHKLT